MDAFFASLAPLSRRAPFALFCVKMFFIRYAGHCYYDAYTWARRLAETYCHHVLALFHIDDEWLSLSEMAYSLPDWIWRYRAIDHVESFGVDRDLAMQLGLPLSANAVFEDIDYLRWVGNSTAHARPYVHGHRPGPDARAVVSVVRVAMSLRAWLGRCSSL